MSNLSLLSYSLGWLVGRQPALLYQSLNYLLLTEIKTQERDSDFLQLGNVFAPIDDPCGAFEGELPFQFHKYPTEEDIYVDRTANLLFLTVDKPLPSVLGVVRYTLFNMAEQIIEVSEFRYSDTHEEMERLQDEVTSALSVGMDVAILTAREAEDFPMVGAMTKHG